MAARDAAIKRKSKRLYAMVMHKKRRENNGKN